jgi:gluconolactonase
MSDWEMFDTLCRNLVMGTAKMEKLFTGTRWAEGPVWFADHRCLLFSDIPNDRMLRLDEDGSVSTFRSPSRFANGNTRDIQGRLVSCQHGSRSVVRTEYDGSFTVLSDAYGGKRLNSPNDLVVSSDGAVWFTDPPYGILSDYEGGRADSEQGGNHVYRIDPVSAKTERVADDFDKPNGLAFSPDEARLYIADSGASHTVDGPRHVRVFRVGDGRAGGPRLSGGEVFAEIDAGVPDGLRVDEYGNVWVGCGDGVRVYSPSGVQLGLIRVPEAVANLTFGGPKRNRLFMTATSSVYSLYVNARGAYRA